MYLEQTTGYYRGTEQATKRASFLLLVQKEGCDEIRALVRKVALRQCGHWMMGRARVAGETITVSGAYGGDGLTRNVSKRVFERAVPLPAELREAWNHGGGWNGAGNEAPAMRAWALENIDKLTA